MNGRRLNNQGQRRESNAVHRCRLHKRRVNGRPGLAAIFPMHAVGAIHGFAALHGLIGRHDGRTVKSVSREGKTQHCDQDWSGKAH